jgi:hypothetical protein
MNQGLIYYSGAGSSIGLASAPFCITREYPKECPTERAEQGKTRELHPDEVSRSYSYQGPRDYPF